MAFRYGGLTKCVNSDSREAQESKVVSSEGRQFLESVIMSIEVVMSRRDILSNVPGSASVLSEANQSIQPPSYTPQELPDRGTSKSSGNFLSSLSQSFKAMTASLRPKPEPLVIAMCQSARDGNIHHLKGFISQGANMNGQNEEGLTPLICAIRANQMEAFQALVDAGADRTTRDSCSGKKKPPLFHAAELGNLKMAETLINLGVDIRERSWSGQPFFIEVANSDKLEIIRLFLSRGIEANMISISGRTIFIHALQNGSLDHLRLLTGTNPP
jgi:ankyrin repeat protein